jgi:tetratricopeptide (TPR) repeat protein
MAMRTTVFIFSLLLIAFSLTTWLDRSFQDYAGARGKSADVLTVALGDSRRLFAKHFYAKADAYFHNGYYPSIYDTRPDADKLHMAANAGAGHGEEEAGMGFLGKPKNWIDAFGRNFFPSSHEHLSDDDHDDCKHSPGESCNHAPHKSKRLGGEERELLPWLQLSAMLDPERVETYLVASYWLRTQLGKINEAEQFLRQGLRANPGHQELLFELGRIYFENRHDSTRARNVWELALKKWHENEEGKAKANTFLYEQILGQLARLEFEEKNYARALEHYKALKEVSPFKDSVQKTIEETEAKLKGTL